MLNRFKLQDFIFEKKPSRLALMDYSPKQIGWQYKVAIYRNHSFELLQNTIYAYIEYAGIDIDFLYSDYDDSLSYLDLDISADLVVLWLDLSRYEMDDVGSFVKDRVTVLQQIYDKNILLVPFEGNCSINNDRVATYPINDWKELLGDKYLDSRLESFSGTKLSVKACLAISKDLGLNWLPALLKGNLKCIVVDLDNTLYQGVLGEDGIEGVRLTDGHRKLQEKLITLGEQGILLCVASKNDERDVIDLLEKRKDFPLDTGHFTKICAHWDSKAKSISDIARGLNIHPSSFLFVDDNMGELVSVFEAHPGIHQIRAKDDALLTLEALANYPGLMKLSVKAEDTLRSSDIKANELRREMIQQVSKEEYIQSLEMKLTFSVDDANQVARVVELSNKTNQFIFNYMRYSVGEVQKLITASSSTIVSVSLSDKLSDSGTVGVVVCRKGKDLDAVLEECFVSCRALGRGIDKAIVLGAIEVALQKLEVKKLKIQFEEGERNLPAKNFVDSYMLDYVNRAKNFSYEIPSNIIKINVK